MTLTTRWTDVRRLQLTLNNFNTLRDAQQLDSMSLADLEFLQCYLTGLDWTICHRHIIKKYREAKAKR